uniref:RING-type domain-containing protein n=1 Tax=Pinctada fucata TaxID=50426 RepID=A0A194AME1_PINFU
MGYQRETIQTAIQRFHRRYGNRTNCSAEILVDIIGNTQQENAQPTDDHNDTENSHNETNDLSTGDQLVAENRRLRRQRLCRVCQDKDANIAMLPCGHLLCCSDCAPAMRKCPACKAIVKGTVRTFLV